MSTEDVPALLERADADGMVARVMRDCTVQELFGFWGLSKVAARRLVSRTQLQGPNVHVSATRLLRVGDAVHISFELPPATVRIEAMPASVLWQDRFCLAANKPSGLLVHGDGTPAPTLTDDVRAHLAAQARTGVWSVPPVPQALQRLTYLPRASCGTRLPRSFSRPSMRWSRAMPWTSATLPSSRGQ